MKNFALTLILFLSITAAKAQQLNQSYIDSLKRELSVAREDTNKVKLLFDLSQTYITSSADTGIAYAQQTLKLANKVGFQKGILYAEGILSVALTISGNYPLGLDHAFKAVALAKKVEPQRVPWALSLVSWCYIYLGEYKTALKYTRESVKLAQPWELPFGWRDLAVAYHKLNQPDSALFYAKKAYEKIKGTDGEGNIAHILGDAYAGKLQYDSAHFYYRNGVSASLKYNSQTDVIDSYNGTAGMYKAMNNLDSAAWYSRKVLSEKLEKKYPIGLLRAANMLADIYGAQNKPDSTLKYLRMAINLQDSLFSREKTLAIQNLSYKEKEKQAEIEASELKFKNRLRIYLLLGGVLTLLIIAGILFKNNRNKQKAFALLQKQKQETDIQKTKVEQTLTELKSTQSQLIQAEKMASLGELTAGIAHEIQNPLNFVNNFSEVSAEMADEMQKEFVAGNKEEVLVLVSNIKQNLEKILHHGKRADAIVKGMLQHTRNTTGKKEPTNINALAEEYLRLAYHGLRAKDKMFKATMDTNFDNSIGKIDIIPQDIGRVILNLINNAFYATTEKKKKQNDNFEPLVSVVTKKILDKVSISVKDNGNGIPQQIADKIFQPFFTTKPAGEGTGLGLSLSYDIIKAHGGELQMQTKVGEGSEFIVLLPNGAEVGY